MVVVVYISGKYGGCAFSQKKQCYLNKIKYKDQKIKDLHQLLNDFAIHSSTAVNKLKSFGHENTK